MNRPPTHKLKAWLADERGGIAAMAAVIMVPLCVVGLGALEYHHLVLTRTELQNAIDAATLAAARSGKRTGPELKAAGLPVLKAHLKRGQASRKLRDEDVSFVRSTGKVDGQAKVCVAPVISGMLGVPESCIRAEAEVKREDMAIEVALVLDSSGSMENWSPSAGMRRIDALEAAAKGFIDKLQTLDDPSLPDDVRIGLVPYAGSVKLDPSNRGAWWLDAAGASSVNQSLFYSMNEMLAGREATVARPQRFAYFDALGIGWAGCVESRPGDYAVNDDPPNNADPNSLFVPYFAPDELDTVLRPDPNTANDPQPITYPNNYLNDGLDRDFPVNGQFRRLNHGETTWVYDTYWKELQYVVEKYARVNVNGTMVAPPLTAAAAAIAANDKGPNRWCKTDPVRPLSADFAGLKTSLDVIPTARHTNIPLGLMWGWHLVAPHAPFGNAKPYRARNVTKVVVLLTDGHTYLDPPGTEEDTPNRNESYYNALGYIWRHRLGAGVGLGSTHAQRLTALDAQMQTLCTRMKAEGVEIYTIQLEAGITANQQLIACSGQENFLNAVNASQLNSVFQQIADNVLNLRVAN